VVYLLYDVSVNQSASVDVIYMIVLVKLQDV